MRRFRMPWIVLLVLGTLGGVLRGVPGKEITAERITSLIDQLGDEAFAKREAAHKAIDTLGEQALPALRKAAVENGDAEIRRRCRRLIRTIMLGSRISSSTKMQFELVDAGEFEMGSPTTEKGRRPDEVLHKLRISRPFLLGKYEVTQSEYQQVMNNNPSWFAKAGKGQEKIATQEPRRFPVENLTWYDALEFCNRLSKLDAYEAYYDLDDVKREADSIKSANVTLRRGNGYRLPTEAEWEFACRAGTMQPFHFGRWNSGREANLKAGPATGYGAPTRLPPLERTTTVGSYAANPLGICDMHGNVAEWCWDWYGKDYYRNSPTRDPEGPHSGHHRTLRGGSWLVNEESCRSASRFWLSPDEGNYYTGFRVARTP